MSLVLDGLIFTTSWIHVLLAPYTKVEESFNLHATHDVLMYGIGVENLYNYDHFTFPGVVPRTFIGSLLLAWVSTPLIWLTAKLGFLHSKFEIQIIIRLVLASLNAWSLCLIRRGVARRFGRGCGMFFSLLTCSQFHLPFWMGRTTPNMFATIPVNFATRLLIDRAPNSKRPSKASLKLAVALLTCTAVIFRAEVALLLAPLCLHLLFTRRLSFLDLVRTGLISGLVSISLTVCIDSYFWVKFPLWPEFSGIYFNVIEGKSAEWGTSPPLAYVTSYLPKLLLGSLPLSIVGFFVDKRIRSLLYPACSFVLLISFLGHKEWRFVVYIIPMFNVAGARGAKWMVSLKKSLIFGRLCFLTTIGLLVANVLFTALSLKASISNYPGGEALLRLQQKWGDVQGPSVHISNLAAQTGASLFLHLHSPPYHTSHHVYNSKAIASTPWRYNKTENLSPSTLSSSPFTFLISEIPESSNPILQKHWITLESIRSFDKWAVNWELLKGRRKSEFLKKIWEVVEMRESEKLWLLSRNRRSDTSN